MTTEVIHFTGTVIVDGSCELSELWAVDGQLRLEQPARTVDRHFDGVVLPGLVDVHCHIGLGESGAVPPEEARRQAVADRESGVLLARDAGCPREPYSTRWLDGEDWAPRLIRCGQHLARTKRYIRHLPRDVTPEQLPDAVEQEALAGDGWVKLVGDWIDRSLERPDLSLLWPDDQLKAAVERAHRVGARVTTHVFSWGGAAQALRCGVDCIEHGTGMDSELMARARVQGVPVVPTMIQRENFAPIAAAGQGKFPEWEEHLLGLYEERYHQAWSLYEAGVTLLVGTDESTNIPHGSIGVEVALMERAGIPAPVIVEAASYGARRFLGVPGITEGASADVVVYASDPRADVTVLADPQAVVLRGQTW
jgi:imidazolonepropionase-like amidohydrolase